MDVAQEVAGKNTLAKAYKAALGDTKFRDLDGRARLTFPTLREQPYPGGVCLHACLLACLHAWLGSRVPNVVHMRGCG